jgi:putative transposase
MSDRERERALEWRRAMRRPWHSLHHVDSGAGSYLITAACFEHRLHIGHSTERMSAFTDSWLEVLEAHSDRVTAWVVLPNHYHALLVTSAVRGLLRALGRLHGRTSHAWNGEENNRGRQVWCNAAETVIKSEGHYYATLNYVHHNPVKHHYARRWSDWPWSSADDFLKRVPREEATRIWKSYPIDEYGTGWDDAEM